MENLSNYIIDKIEDLIFYRVSVDDALVSTNLLDSIAMVDLVVAIQEKTAITIPFTEINKENFETVNKILDYLKSKS